MTANFPVTNFPSPSERTANAWPLCSGTSPRRVGAYRRLELSRRLGKFGQLASPRASDRHPRREVRPSSRTSPLLRAAIDDREDKVRGKGRSCASDQSRASVWQSRVVRVQAVNRTTARCPGARPATLRSMRFEAAASREGTSGWHYEVKELISWISNRRGWEISLDESLLLVIVARRKRFCGRKDAH